LTTGSDELESLIGLDRTLHDYARAARAALVGGDARFEQMKAAYRERFPDGSAERGVADALAWAVLGDSLTLFYLGLTSSVIVELHATLEHYARRDLPQLITSTHEGRNVAEQLVERRTLSDLSKMLVSLGVWNDEDCAFVLRLARLRNGIVHNNEVALGRAMSGQNFHHINDARLAVADVDVLPFLLSAIAALGKLATGSTRHRKRSTEERAGRSATSEFVSENTQ
jgi:hypothetical protein